MADLVELLRDGEFERVLRFCEQELEKNSQEHNLFIVKGWCLYELGQLDQAKAVMNQWPRTDQLHRFAVGLVQDFFFITEDHEKMIALCEYFLTIYPDDQELIYKMALSQGIIGQEHNCISSLQYLLSLKRGRNHLKAKINLACLLLNQHQYEEAFELYEARFEAYGHCDWLLETLSDVPQWQGESLKDRSILLWAEQGLGDTIQFSRFVTVLAEQGAQVSLLIYGIHRSLYSLLCGLDGVVKVYQVNENSFSISDLHYHCPLMGVMKRIGFTDQSIPSKTPYLTAVSAHHQKWSQLRESNSFKVGIVWSTETKVDGYKEKRKLGDGLGYSSKNIPVSYWQDVLAIPEIDFYTLQYNAPEEDIECLSGKGVVDMTPMIQDFNDTSAIIEHMDMVVSIDTSVVHLAGAMAKPTIVLLPYVNDWRWQEGRSDSPWYPNMTLIRQQEKDSWKPVMEELYQMLLEQAP